LHCKFNVHAFKTQSVVLYVIANVVWQSDINTDYNINNTFRPFRRDNLWKDPKHRIQAA